MLDGVQDREHGNSRGPVRRHGSHRMYYQSKCRCDVCVAWWEAQKPKALANLQRWRTRNPEKKKALVERYRAKNREPLRVKALAYYHAQMDSDPERVRARRRNWVKTPQGVIANRLARHKRRGAESDEIAPEWVEIILADPCVYCGDTATEVDHIVPLNDGGTGDWFNLAPACRADNAAKNDQRLLPFLLRKAA